MKRIDSEDQYKKLFADRKTSDKELITNMQFYFDSVVEHIKNGRLFYEESPLGIQLYLKQNGFYKFYFMWEKDKKMICEKVGKPLFAYYVHMDSNNVGNEIDKMLKAGGFIYKDTLKGYDYDPNMIISSTSPYIERIRRYIEKKGYKLRTPEINEYEKVIDFVHNIEEIPYWQIEYRSEKEAEEDIRDGMVKCVFDSEKRICGGVYSYIIGQYEYGWIAVDKMHRFGGFLATLLSNEKSKGQLDRGHRGRGWIDVNNTASVIYHERLGYEFNGRYREEYIHD